MYNPLQLKPRSTHPDTVSITTTFIEQLHASAARLGSSLLGTCQAASWVSDQTLKVRNNTLASLPTGKWGDAGSFWAHGTCLGS